MNIPKTKSQEALNDLKALRYCGYDPTEKEWYESGKIEEDYKEEVEAINKDLEHLQKLQSMTYLLYSGRKKLVNEYSNWCEKNCVFKEDLVNYTTWLLNIKLRNFLEN